MKRLTPFLLLSVILLSCSESHDECVSPSLDDAQVTVAVVAPLSDDATKARLERTAQWLLDNMQEAHRGETASISLNIEWHDEQTENIDSLGRELSVRSDVSAVIGPFSEGPMARFAPYCKETLKPLIAPTITSETLLRRYAVASAGESGMVNRKQFFWPLCQSDINLTETMLGHYVTMSGKYAGLGALNCAVFSPSDDYGKTFSEWVPFFADRMNVLLSHNERYSSTAGLNERLSGYFDDLENSIDSSSAGTIVNALLSNNYCVVENLQQLLYVAQERRRWLIALDGGDASDPVWDDRWQSFEYAFRTWFVYSGLSEEALTSLGADARKLYGYQGFSPYADPSTGFERAYQERFGVIPTFAECKLYDALLLVSLAARRSSNLNAGIYQVAAANGASVSGVSGPIAFDTTSCIQLTPNYYVHWQIVDNQIRHLTYYGPNGKQVAGSSVGVNLFYDEETATKDFADMSGDSDYGIQYPPLTDQYAVLVQGSRGMANYRHQSDVLAMYQLLRRGGYDDDHITLVLDTSLANDPDNNEPGIIRGGTDMADLLGGTDADRGYPAATVDYGNDQLSPADICDILKSIPAGSNILLYWSGHGRNESHGGVNELQWLDNDAGQGMTVQLLQQTLEEMSPRKMFIILEPCYSEGVARAAKGQTGVLAMTGARGDEKSWAENWNPHLGRYGTWMCDRFTLNVLQSLHQQPVPTYRDLYFYCMQNTIGSHVQLVNADNFGNLFRLTPEEFIKYQQQ